ncbi:MAG: DHH family phosphoesterase, partial [Ruminiclostridium sp.]|nr:DHH family phosphoesterase [Ruminiclostridium sp.]
DELLGVSDVNASFVISKTAGGEVSLSCRSLGAINVQLIAEKLGGGGHQTMAGAQFKGERTGQVYQKLKEAIDQYYESLNS